MNLADHRDALRRAGRERQLAELRDGRRQRATRIPSGRTYKRRTKHRNTES